MKTTDLEGSIAVVEVSGDERRRVLFPHQVKGWEIARAALVIAAEEDAGRDAVESFGRLYQKTAGTTRALPPDVGMPALLKELGAERGSKIVRSIARLALSCETEFPAAATGVIRLARLVSAEQSLTRRQAAVIVACGLLGLFRETNDFMFDFGFLVTSGPPVVPSLRGIVHYLGRVSDAMPPGRLLFRRLVGRQVDWKSMSSLPLVEVECRTGGRIEECLGMLQIDFANRHLGGGVLRGGCAQEEIRFGICSPELIAGMLFCDDMEDSEAIVIEGSEQFSTYDGYGRAVSWAGNFEDRAPKSHDGSLLTTVVAIDALMFPMDSQATPPMIRRELFKVRTPPLLFVVAVGTPPHCSRLSQSLSLPPRHSSASTTVAGSLAPRLPAENGDAALSEATRS